MDVVRFDGLGVTKVTDVVPPTLHADVAFPLSKGILQHHTSTVRTRQGSGFEHLAFAGKLGVDAGGSGHVLR